LVWSHHHITADLILSDLGLAAAGLLLSELSWVLSVAADLILFELGLVTADLIDFV
jgi:hypothetical protein